jgi:hypothetical protein
MSDIRNYNPPPPAKPLGDYTHVSRIKASEFLHIAGQVFVDASGKLIVKSEARQVFENLRVALASADADFTNVVKLMTWSILRTSKSSCPSGGRSFLRCFHRVPTRRTRSSLSVGSCRSHS